MKPYALILGMSAAFAAFVPTSGAAQETPESAPALQAPAPQGEVVEEVSPVSPEAAVILREMSRHMSESKSATYRLTDTIDDVEDDGRKIQYSHFREMTVVRPDKLKVEVKGDVTNRILWKDGKTITVLDTEERVYAQLPDPGTINDAVDLLQDKYGLSIPAADFLSDDVYATLTEGCSSVEYLGMSHVGEDLCHHFAFRRDVIDYQLWASTGDKVKPRKLVITYKKLPGAPQYTLVLLSAEMAPGISDDVFAAKVPQEAMKIEFQPSGNVQ
jgi:hypothetical protein